MIIRFSERLILIQCRKVRINETLEAEFNASQTKLTEKVIIMHNMRRHRYIDIACELIGAH